ncbi:MAG TPA: stage III sporulation protein AA [Bacillota bacterium]|nr:stage III sporulation protein AA [Bacillota bacterium]HOR85624.1 stage III sporulation protein AA [Bacillota bacterium]HPL52762.1 stage III sporulation protein AA [Bacillota bacterium]
MNNNFNISEVLDYLPKHIKTMVIRLSKESLQKIEEIRLRLAKPLCATGCCSEIFIGADGEAEPSGVNAYIINEDDLRYSMQLVCNFSMYSVEEELKNGFVTVNGGHRVGICGRAVIENGKVKTLKDISYMNFRVAKQIIGASDKVIGYIIRSPDSIYNTLIISPPQCGKTTLLRDVIRKLSSGGEEKLFRGMKVSLIDERSEVAACSLGIPRNEVGMRTDVLDGCPKAEGIIMMIRSMSPEIIATDEIGRLEDANAITDAVNAGVKVITTIHGSSIEDFLNKQSLNRIHKEIFERYVVLSRKNGAGTLETVLDGKFNILFERI